MMRHTRQLIHTHPLAHTLLQPVAVKKMQHVDERFKSLFLQVRLSVGPFWPHGAFC